MDKLIKLNINRNSGSSDSNTKSKILAWSTLILTTGRLQVIKMNYKKVYRDLIESRLKNPPKENFEKHHILPKSLFPEKAKDERNLVKLDYKAHYVAHHLLYLHYKSIGDKNAMNKMAHAWMRMCKNNNGSHVSINEFKKAKDAHILALKNPTDEFRIILGNGNRGKPSKMKGRHFSEKARKNMKAAHQFISLETRKKLSIASAANDKGRIWINNGIENKFIYPNEIPDGYVKGRIYKRKIVKKNK